MPKVIGSDDKTMRARREAKTGGENKAESVLRSYICRALDEHSSTTIADSGRAAAVVKKNRFACCLFLNPHSETIYKWNEQAVRTTRYREQEKTEAILFFYQKKKNLPGPYRHSSPRFQLSYRTVYNPHNVTCP